MLERDRLCSRGRHTRPLDSAAYVMGPALPTLCSGSCADGLDSAASHSSWPGPRYSCRCSHRAMTSGDRRVACDRRVQAGQADSDAPLTARCPVRLPLCLICFFGISDEGQDPRGDTSRRRKTTAVTSAAFRRERRGSLGDPNFRSGSRTRNSRPGGIGTGHRAVSGASQSAWSGSTRRSQATLRSPEPGWTSNAMPGRVSGPSSLWGGGGPPAGPGRIQLAIPSHRRLRLQPTILSAPNRAQAPNDGSQPRSAGRSDSCELTASFARSNARIDTSSPPRAISSPLPSSPCVRRPPSSSSVMPRRIVAQREGSGE